MKLRTERPVTEFSIDLLSRILFEDFGLNDKTQFIVGFSGGCDSRVLLHGLVLLRNRSNIEVIAAHFDHGLQDQSTEWAKHCQNWCDEYQVDLVSVRREIQPGSGDSTEAIAREARYRWLGEISSPQQVVVTAHHADDQAETFLINLFQGKEIDQLAGIAPSRSLLYESETKLSRPLLAFSRAQIVTYAKKCKLEWVEDPSNFHLNFYRNYIRQELMPALSHRCPGIVASLKRGAVACRKIAERDRARTEKLYLMCRAPESRGIFCLTDPLNLHKLTDCDEFEITGLFRHWIHNAGYASPTKGQLATLYHQIIEKKASRATLDFNGLAARFFKGYLYLIQPVRFQGFKTVSWDLSPIDIPQIGITVKFASKDSDSAGRHLLQANSFHLVWRAGGERILFNNRQHHSSLKKVFQASNVPPWERDCLPFLKINDEISWVHGIGRLGKYAIDPDYSGICLRFSRIND